MQEKHILNTNNMQEAVSLCGVEIEYYEKHFEDIDLAFWDAKIEGKLRACQSCVREVMKVLKVPVTVEYKEQPRNKV
jgi:hypothetical protein